MGDERPCVGLCGSFFRLRPLPHVDVGGGVQVVGEHGRRVHGGEFGRHGSPGGGPLVPPPPLGGGGGDGRRGEGAVEVVVLVEAAVAVGHEAGGVGRLAVHGEPAARLGAAARVVVHGADQGRGGHRKRTGFGIWNREGEFLSVFGVPYCVQVMGVPCREPGEWGG